MTEYIFYAICTIGILGLISLFMKSTTATKETLYFRFRCSNILDIEFYAYVQARRFFDDFNDRLAEYLRLYVQEQFYASGVAYEDLKLTVEVDYQCIHAICYIKIPKNNKQYDNIQQKIIQNLNLKQQILAFYQFYQTINKPENLAVFKFKQPDESEVSVNNLIPKEGYLEKQVPKKVEYRKVYH